MMSLHNTIDNFNLPVQPRHLTFLKCSDDCSFCENPKGQTYIHYISIFEKSGYLSCENCIEKGKYHVANWFETKAFGKANRLQNKNIKIKRSSGIIESDWKLDKNFPSTFDHCNGQMYVYCINDTLQIEKCCSIDELLELNPHELE
jgi:hypothetical protein